MVCSGSANPHAPCNQTLLDFDRSASVEAKRRLAVIARHLLEGEESTPPHDAHALRNNLLQLLGAVILGHRRSLLGLAGCQHLKGMLHKEPHADLSSSHLDQEML